MGELVLLPCERSSIVPGTFQWLPRGPCSFPSPPQLDRLFFPQKHKHINTHILSTSVCHISLSHSVSFTLSFSVTLLSRSVSLSLSFCFYPPLPPPPPPPFLNKQHKALSLLLSPPPSSLPVPHYFASSVRLSCWSDSKSKNMQSSNLRHLIFKQQKVQCFQNVYRQS